MRTVAPKAIPQAMDVLGISSFFRCGQSRGFGAMVERMWCFGVLCRGVFYGPMCRSLDTQSGGLALGWRWRARAAPAQSSKAFMFEGRKRGRKGSGSVGLGTRLVELLGGFGLFDRALHVPYTCAFQLVDELAIVRRRQPELSHSRIESDLKPEAPTPLLGTWPASFQL